MHTNRTHLLQAEDLNSEKSNVCDCSKVLAWALVKGGNLIPFPSQGKCMNWFQTTPMLTQFHPPTPALMPKISRAKHALALISCLKQLPFSHSSFNKFLINTVRGFCLFLSVPKGICSQDHAQTAPCSSH